MRSLRSVRCRSRCTRSSCVLIATATPRTAIQDEVIDVPELGPHDALVMVMAAGVNFNNVWAARGVPVDVTKTQARWGEPTDFHIVGSDASGIVYAIGDEVTNVRGRRPRRRACGPMGPRRPLGAWPARIPGLAASFRVWGYDTCWGSFAQFCKVQAHQCLPKAGLPHVGGGCGADAHRRHRLPHALRLAPAHRGAGRRRARVGRERRARLARRPARRERRWPAVAVVSSEEKGEYATAARRGRLHQPQGLRRTGASRRPGTAPSGRTWFDGAKAFGKAIWDVLGEQTSPRIVFEHPGEDTIPTSIFVADRGGMVVICAGTSGLRHDGRRALPLVPCRSATRARTCSTTSRRRRSTSSCATARSARRSARSTPTTEPGTRTS